MRVIINIFSRFVQLRRRMDHLKKEFMALQQKCARLENNSLEYKVSLHSQIKFFVFYMSVKKEAYYFQSYSSGFISVSVHSYIQNISCLVRSSLPADICSTDYKDIAFVFLLYTCLKSKAYYVIAMDIFFY